MRISDVGITSIVSTKTPTLHLHTMPLMIHLFTQTNIASSCFLYPIIVYSIKWQTFKLQALKINLISITFYGLILRYARAVIDVEAVVCFRTLGDNYIRDGCRLQMMFRFFALGSCATNTGNLRREHPTIPFLLRDWKLNTAWYNFVYLLSPSTYNTMQ